MLPQAGNPRAWANPDLITPALLGLYRRPMHVHGWDVALTEASQEGLEQQGAGRQLETRAAFVSAPLAASGVHACPALLAVRPGRLAHACLCLTPPTVMSFFLQVCRASGDITSLERSHLLSTLAVYRLPTMVATGERDHITTPAAMARVAERLGPAAPRLAVLPSGDIGGLVFE